MIQVTKMFYNANFVDICRIINKTPISERRETSWSTTMTKGELVTLLETKFDTLSKVTQTNILTYLENNDLVDVVKIQQV